jgi:hypothetical protein
MPTASHQQQHHQHHHHHHLDLANLNSFSVLQYNKYLGSFNSALLVAPTASSSSSMAATATTTTDPNIKIEIKSE